MEDYLANAESIILQKEVKSLRAATKLLLVLFFVSNAFWFVAWLLVAGGD
jgi:hypothetical protein